MDHIAGNGTALLGCFVGYSMGLNGCGHGWFCALILSIRHKAYYVTLSLVLLGQSQTCTCAAIFVLSLSYLVFFSHAFLSMLDWVVISFLVEGVGP